MRRLIFSPALLPCIFEIGRCVSVWYSDDSTAQLFHLADGSVSHVAFPLHALGEVPLYILPVRSADPNLTGCTGVSNDEAGLLVGSESGRGENQNQNDAAHDPDRSALLEAMSRLQGHLPQLDRIKGTSKRFPET